MAQTMASARMFAGVRPTSALVRSSFGAQRVVPFVSTPAFGLHGRNVSSRGALVVVAAEPKKGLDSGEQRDKLSKAARLINRTYRSAVNTRIKKVIKLAEEYKAKIEVIGTEDDVKPLEQLISEAYTEIDKAVKRNLLHKNNGARKKARIARYKRDVLVQAGLYTPLPDQPGFKALKAAPLRQSA